MPPVHSSAGLTGMPVSPMTHHFVFVNDEGASKTTRAASPPGGYSLLTLGSGLRVAMGREVEDRDEDQQRPAESGATATNGGERAVTSRPAQDAGRRPDYQAEQNHEREPDGSGRRIHRESFRF
jgi:hypothetical protein